MAARCRWTTPSRSCASRRSSRTRRTRCAIASTGSAPRATSAALSGPESTVISTNQFKNGNPIEVDGTVFKVLEFQHVNPGKGAAFVRTKLRRTSDGNVIDKTFRAGEKFRSVRTEGRKMQFLYGDGTDSHFMDSESYEQITVRQASLEEELRWTKRNEQREL